MQIQVTTDNHIKGSPELTSLVENIVEGALTRFGDRVTKVVAHFTDENSAAKKIGNDKRCVLEVRIAGHQPIVVTNDGSTIQEALDGAAEKMEKTLDRTLDRLDKPKGRTSFAGDQS
ncbi:MAG: HPF/RaiA family ribosome-associated protein [Planctomycetota bacterium]|nr:HPF/RaiA family ribosome-associated protein [Planctomycetota bacterium]